MAVLLVVAILATSALWPAEAAKSKPVEWKPKLVNETITFEVVLEVLIKNLDESGDLHGTLKIGLFGEKCPMTTFNFVSLCNGTKRPNGELKFAGSTCHRLIPDMHFQCGDITSGDGNGGVSVFGDMFRDENFDIGHSEKGTISMSNRGPDSNGSQFFILFRPLRSLDGNHVAFGQIIDKASLDFLDKMNDVPVNAAYSPQRKIKLMDCSATKLKKPLTISRTANAKQDRYN